MGALETGEGVTRPASRRGRLTRNAPQKSCVAPELSPPRGGTDPQSLRPEFVNGSKFSRAKKVLPVCVGGHLDKYSITAWATTSAMFIKL